jgi:hypothetical protein
VIAALTFDFLFLFPIVPSSRGTDANLGAFGGHIGHSRMLFILKWIILGDTKIRSIWRNETIISRCFAPQYFRVSLLRTKASLEFAQLMHPHLSASHIDD